MAKKTGRRLKKAAPGAGKESDECEICRLDSGLIERLKKAAEERKSGRSV